MATIDDLHLRAAIPADALAVARIHVRAWQAGYRGLLPAPYLDGLRAEDRAARYTFDVVAPDRPATIVAVAGDAICGFATTGPATGDETAGAGELLAIHVDPDCWRRGVGRALIAAARARLVRDGRTEAVVWIIDGNERAAHFYEADGWSRDGGRRVDEVWGVEVSELRYRRSLGSATEPQT